MTLRARVGALWGELTTQGLAGLTVLVAGLQGLDPELLSRREKLLVALAAIAVAVLVGVARRAAPPPPSVTIRREDHVEVSASGNEVTIVKPDGVPADIVSKRAGEST